MFEDLPALMPIQFFGLACDCNFLKGVLKDDRDFALPSTADCLDEESFADFYCSWNEEKISILAEVHVPFQKIGESDFRKGDSLEIFIDTRDLKSKAVITRFCHHFVFFPVEHQGHYGREISRFRNEDTHRLCSPEDLEVKADLKSNSYTLSIEIPAHCLLGYDPEAFPKIGFSYQLNRADGPPQHFAVSSHEYAIEQHPALWATLKLQS
ncbi:MAG: hypothetical protein JSS32_09710 [Verrucomicrobia bacterium]|nr:hypothetical protein [Verrucomicrobiota bacterium]